MSRGVLTLAALIGVLLGAQLAGPAWAAAAPANDAFAAAQPFDLSSEDGSMFGTTVDATREQGEPLHAGQVGGTSVWYRWTAQATGIVDARTCGQTVFDGEGYGSGDTLLAVYTGSRVDALTAVASNDDSAGCFLGGGSRVTFLATAGQEYRIAVDAWGGAPIGFYLTLTPPPVNDAYANAMAIDASASDSNERATSEPGEPAHAGEAAAHSLWYRWTAAFDGPANVELCGFGRLDPRFAVYTGAQRTEVARGQPGGCDEDAGAVASFDAHAGTEYRIAVDGRGGTTGSFDLRVHARPRNDAFADATTIDLEGANDDTTFATKQAGEPNHAGNAGGHSVWHRWTAPESGEVALNVCGQGFKALLAVYTGSSVSSLTPVASTTANTCEDFVIDGLSFDAVAGRTYLIALDGKDGASGRSLLYFVDERPFNDDLSNPESASEGSTSGTNRLATKEAGEPNHAGNAGGHSVWFQWYPDVSGPATVSVCDARFDTLLGVYKPGPGGGMQGLTQLAAADDTAGCGAGGSRVSLAVDAFTPYLVAVDGKGGASGRFTLDLATAPANDAFDGAFDLLPGDERDDRSLGASKQPGEPNHAGNLGGSSVWYRWTADASGTVAIDTCGSATTFDTLLAVYRGENLAALTPVAASDDAAECGPGSKASSVTFAATADTTYQFAIDGKGAAAGAFAVHLAVRPPNDDLAAAATTLSGRFGTSGSLRAAGREAGEPNHAGDPGGHSVWYRWVAARSGPATIDTCQSFFDGDLDTVLAVYSGTTYATLLPIVSNDDTPGCASGVGSTVSFTAAAGAEYRIAVAGKGGRVGDFDISVHDPPANDGFADASPVTTSLDGDNRNASKQAGEPNHGGDPGGHSVWFRLTALRTGTYSVLNCRYQLDTVVGVYAGTALASLTPIGTRQAADPNADCEGSGGERISFAVQAGGEYRIAVDGRAGAQGDFFIDLVPPPPGDQLAEAVSLEGSSRSLEGTNARAGKEAGEPNHAGNAGGHSVWYRWVAPSSGTATVDVCDSGFDTLLGIYRGNAVGVLTRVADSDDSATCSHGQGSRVSFAATAGTSYAIAVDGKAGASGSFRIAVNPPANDQFAAATALTGDSASVSGTTLGATLEADDPLRDDDVNGSVWYRWTPSQGGPASVEACADQGATPELGVYAGAKLVTLVTRGSGGSARACPDRGRRVSFTAVAGTTYRIVVAAGFEEAGGPFQLTLNGLAHDPFATPRTLRGINATDSGSTAGATKEGGEPAHAGDLGGHSVWYRWKAPTGSPGQATIDTCQSGFDTLLAVYTGTQVGQLSQVAANDDDVRCGAGSTASSVTFAFEPGREYRIAIDGRGGAAGAYAVHLAATLPPPPNDAFANARLLDGAVGTFAGSTINAGKEAGEPSHAGNAGGHSVWYRWVAPASGQVTLDTCGSDFDTLLAVYTGSALASLAPVTSSDDAAACGSASHQSQVQFTATAGTAYRIAVDGKAGDSGELVLHLNRPSNDDFANATTITGSFAALLGTTAGASAEAFEPVSGAPPSSSVWYQWTAPQSGSVYLHTCTNAGSPMDLQVYRGNSLSALTWVGSYPQAGASCTSDVVGSSSALTALVFSATAGTTYRIAVDAPPSLFGIGRSGAGPFTLQFNAPTNDLRAAALRVNGVSPTANASNVGASLERGETPHAAGASGASVWFRWYAPGTGSATVDTCASGIDTALSVETTTGTRIASNDDAAGCGTGSTRSRASFAAIAGETYWIGVDGKGGATGAIALHVAGAADVTPPETTGAPYFGSVVASSFGYVATSSEPGSSFDCAVDGGSFSPCPTFEQVPDSEVRFGSVNGLADGAHTLRLRAVDLAGLIDATPASVAFTVDSTPPDTTIAAGPASVTKADPVHFEFSSNEAGVHFECSVDGEFSWTCSTPYDRGLLAEGNHSISVWAVDAAGNRDPSPAQRSFRIDRTPPSATVLSGPTGLTRQRDAQFGFQVDDASATLECALDFAPFAPCSSPYAVTGMHDGSHTVSVRATDPAGNVQPIPATRSFVVDTTPPVSFVTSGPAPATNDPTPSFSFEANEATSAVVCALDGAPLAPCASPLTSARLADGPHTLRLSATDLAGNQETPPSDYPFTVDTVAPETSIASGPDGLTRPPARFDFTASESVDRYECAVDGGPFAACGSVFTLPPLADGAHTLRVRAVDAAGNVDASPAVGNLTLDSTAPVTTILAGPSGTIAVDSVDLAFSVNEPADFLCTLDAEPSQPCTSPWHVQGLSDGDHALTVYAVDRAGNVEQSGPRRDVHVEARPPETTIGEHPPAVTPETSVTFTFDADESGSRFECSLDAAAFAACSSPRTYDSLVNGPHELRVRAVDLAGKRDPTPAAFSFDVDIAGPETTIDAGPSGLTNVAGPFELGSSEAGGGFECALDGGSFASCASPFTATDLADGEHVLRARAVDAVGNTDQTPAERSFTLDTQGPAVGILLGPPPIAGPDVQVSFSADLDATATECQLDGEPFQACASPVDYTGLPDGRHSLSVRALDAAGNRGAPAVWPFIVDTAPPTTAITDAPPAITRERDVTFSFDGADADAFRCALDDGAFEACASGARYEGLADGDHRFQVQAVDAAGNVDESPAEWRFSVDTVAPDTAITDGPTTPVHDAGLGFEYSSSEDGGTLECAIDAEPFAPCPAVITAESLGAGAHVFQVRALDAAGNVDPSPATWAFTVVNEAPVARLDLDRSEGPAALDVQAAIGGSDGDGDALRFELQWGDGTSSSGVLPEQLSAHRYVDPGVYTLRLAVDDGHDPVVLTRTVTVTLSEPLEAHAGDDVTAIAGQPVLLDGADSRPLRGIESFDWDPGDGTHAAGDVVEHTYAQPGDYDATLTVGALGEQDSDHATVHVVAPDAAGGVEIRVMSGGAPVADADVMVVLPQGDGRSSRAVSDANGVARLIGLPDGQHKVYAYRPGYLPAVGNATVDHGAGSGSVELTAGDTASARVESRRLSLAEIEAAGIDTSDPDNQHVFQFEVHLNLEGGGSYSGYVSRGGFIHGAGSSCAGSTCVSHVGGRTAISRISYVEDTPILSTLVIPMKASFLKEFYDVSLIVSNLAAPDFTLHGGHAAIEVPDGLSLAQTSGGQHLTVPLDDIHGGESKAAHWILRGDKEGEYQLGATYAGTLEPFGRTVTVEGRTVDPIKVWGASALKVVVDVDDELRDRYPFGVRVGLRNVADIPVYNPAVELLEGNRRGYIEQPRQQHAYQAREVAPGDTFWAGPFILVPKASGRIDLSRSFIRQTAGDVGLDSTIVTHPRTPAFDQTPELRPVHLGEKVRLSWDPVPGASDYEVYATDDRDSDFPDEPATASKEGDASAVVDPPDPSSDTWYAVSAIVDGRRTLVHPIVRAPDPPPLSEGKEDALGPPTGECGLTKIPVGPAELVASCFKETSLHSNIYDASGRVRVNGVDVLPQAGRIRVNVNTLEIHAESAEVRVGAIVLWKGRLDWSPKLVWKFELPEGSRIKGLPASGKASLTLEPHRASVSAEAKFPTVLGGASGKLSFAANNEKGLRADSFEFTADGLNVAGKIGVKKVLLKYDRTPKGDRWEGGLTVAFPRPQSPLLIGGRLALLNGGFSSAAVEVDGINASIAYGVFLQRLRASIGVNPFSIGGGIGLSAGPQIAGKEGLSVDGDAKITLGTPQVYDVHGSVKVVEAEIASGYFRYETSGLIEFGGTLGLDVHHFKAKLSADGWVDRTTAFNATGHGDFSLPGVSFSAEGVVSSTGVAACRRGSGPDVGAGYRWDGGLHLFSSSCDIGEFEAYRGSAAAVRASGRAVPFDVDRGEPVEVIAFSGKSAPPRVLLSGPDGERIVTPEGGRGLDEPRVMLVQSPDDDTTYVAILRPGAGRWQARPLAGSSPIVRVRRAHALPSPHVRASVSSAGSDQLLRWTLRPIPGQRVSFVERSRHGARVIATTNARSGSVRFTPILAYDRSRQVVAVVEQNGMPRSTTPVTGFQAPRPAPPARPARVRIRRRAATLVVGWPEVHGAQQYRVRVRLSGGRERRYIVPGRRLVIRHVPRGARAIVTVRAEDALGQRGPGRRVRLAAHHP